MIPNQTKLHDSMRFNAKLSELNSKSSCNQDVPRRLSVERVTRNSLSINRNTELSRKNSMSSNVYNLISRTNSNTNECNFQEIKEIIQKGIQKKLNQYLNDELVQLKLISVCQDKCRDMNQAMKQFSPNEDWDQILKKIEALNDVIIRCVSAGQDLSFEKISITPDTN